MSDNNKRTFHRLAATNDLGSEAKPTIELAVTLHKPNLEMHLESTSGAGAPQVCTGNPLCYCVGVSGCACDRVCSCDNVCAIDPACSCDGQCSCHPQCSCNPHQCSCHSQCMVCNGYCICYWVSPPCECNAVCYGY